MFHSVKYTGFRLLNLHGIPKSVHRAFQPLHRLGSEQLPVVGMQETVDASVVRKSQSLMVFLTNRASTS